MRRLVVLVSMFVASGCTFAAYEEHEGASAVATCERLESSLCARIETCMGEASDTCGLTWEGEPVACEDVVDLRVEGASFDDCQDDLDAMACEDVEAGSLPETCQGLAFTLAE
jgi:hypothetical protein